MLSTVSSSHEIYVQALCSVCKTRGPRVEARPGKSMWSDRAAINLAEQVSGFYEVLRPRRQDGQPSRRGSRFIVDLYCRACVRTRYLDMQREVAASISAAATASGFRGVLALRMTPEHQDSVRELMRMREYLGIPEIGAT